MTVIKHWELRGLSLTERLKRHYAGLRMRVQPILEKQPKELFDYERKDRMNDILDEVHDTVHVLRQYAQAFNAQAERLETKLAEHILTNGVTVPDNVVSLFDRTETHD
tara:strand:- start:29142 stop:29465 length:324 start_codon:yes stop_codon:yes gene_type:complete